MPNAVHIQLTELLLDSMSQRDDEGLMASFFFGEPGAPHWDRRMGTDLFYRPNKLTRAALYLRQNGPAYLRYLSISDIWSLLQKFVSENYWYLVDECFFRRFEGSYAPNGSPATKARIAEALAESEIFKPRNALTLFPLVPVQVQDDFDADPFFVVTAAALNARRLPARIDPKYIAPEQFPPIKKWTGRKDVPTAWLGVHAPVPQASIKMKAAILGAFALLPLPRYRYLFSMRKMFGGHCTLSDDGLTTSFTEQRHTPALMHDLVISAVDHSWLTTLASKLTATDRATRRQLHALEYFYRAWETEPSERFPLLCMTLDSIFGEATHATQAVIDGVRNVLGSHVRAPRLRQLMELRASVIHGGAPDVYDSRKYGRYYDDYEADPIHDMELVVATCLRQHIFNGALKENADPNAEVIAEAQVKGQLPKSLKRNTILEDDPTVQP